MANNKNSKPEGLRISDLTAQKIGDLLCARIEQASGRWTKPWASASLAPRSLSGRRYTGANSLLLSALCAERGWRAPVFITLHNVRELGLRLLPAPTPLKPDGREIPFPAFFFKRDIFGLDGHRLTPEELDELPADEREGLRSRWFLKVYNVWNVSQTDFPQRYPDKYAAMVANQEAHDQTRRDPALDLEIEGGAWRCPIVQAACDKAYYAVLSDRIVLPPRPSFASAEAFYGTALHEMTHSTARDLRRDYGAGGFGSPAYAKEELVAELSAALFLLELGVEKSVDNSHLLYLKAWSDTLHDKQAVRLVLDDVLRAVSYHRKAYAAATARVTA